MNGTMHRRKEGVSAKMAQKCILNKFPTEKNMLPQRKKVVCCILLVFVFLASQRQFLLPFNHVQFDSCESIDGVPEETEMSIPHIAILTNESSEMSLQESFGYLNYPESQWSQLKKIHRAQAMRQQGLKSKKGHIYFQNNWEPTLSCLFEQRIGNMGDGGKWVCDAYRLAQAETCNVVSIGNNNEWSFERAIHRLNPRCKIFTFDHTTNGCNRPWFVSFHKIGLGVQDVFSNRGGQGPILSLSSMMKAVGLENATTDLLKIDCEGCEKLVWPTFFNAFFRQILIELHGVDWDVDAFFQAMQANGYVIFHKEPNTLGCYGNCIEYAFLKLDWTTPRSHRLLS